jgi:hypothetical protein
MASSSDGGATFIVDTHSSRSTFSALVGHDGDLLLVGMDGLLRISAAAQKTQPTGASNE